MTQFFFFESEKKIYYLNGKRLETKTTYKLFVNEWNLSNLT